MPEMPGNQQTTGYDAIKTAKSPIFPQAAVIDWEYDIIPVRGRPAGYAEASAPAAPKPAAPQAEAPAPEQQAAAAGAFTGPPPAPLPEAAGADRPGGNERAFQFEAAGAKPAPHAVSGYAPTFPAPKRRLPIALIAVAALLVVIVAALLIFGHRLRGEIAAQESAILAAAVSEAVPSFTLPPQETPAMEAAAPPAVTAPPEAIAPAETAAPPETAAPQEMTEAQAAFGATLYEKLPEALVSMTKLFNQDPVFLEAISQAKTADLIFRADRVEFNILLPDPSAESLDQLGVASYTPHSGAQAFIRDNYAKLCSMDGLTTCILVQATLYPQRSTDGSFIVDWTLPELSGVLYSYEQAFTPQLMEYMKGKGFFTAAMELLMPDFQTWDQHTGTDSDLTQLDEYFESLAEALAPKGITLDEETVVDAQTIKQALKARFVPTWIFDSPDIQMSAYQTALFIRTISGNWFQNTSDEMSAQYEAGAQPLPADLNALEAAYLSNIRQKINAAYGPAGLQGSDIYSRQYVFSWQELGDKGIAACSNLVEEIRQYLFSYDFSLMFMARTSGVISPY